MELALVTKPNLNITTEAETLNWTYSGLTPREVMARVNLGDVAKPVVGGGIYSLRFYINGILIAPTSDIPIQPGAHQAIMVSRPVPLEPGDVISVRVLGQAGDTAIDATTSLRDATPLTIGDVIGYGGVPVDHNYGGPNALQYVTPGGQPISGANILAYLKSDYDSGNRGSAYIQGRSSTMTGGVWSRPLMLSPGNWTLIFYLSGRYGPDRKDIVV